MARSLFGGRASDSLASLYPIGTRQFLAVPDQTVALEVWSAPEAAGGVQLTDLFAADGTTPISGVVVPATAHGQVPAFYGPDGVTQVWFRDTEGDFYRLDADAGAALELVQEATGQAIEAAAAAQAVGATTDAQVEQSLEQRGLPVNGSDLSASYGSLEQLADLRNLAALDQLSTHDQVKAVSSLRTAWESTTVGFTEPWAALTSWTAGDLQVVGGVLLSSAATSGKALRTLSGINTGSFRATVPLIVASGGSPTSQTALFGITASTTVADTAGTNFLGVGLHSNGNLVAYDNNTPTALPTKKGITDPLPAGTYYITMSLTAAEISFSISNAAGTLYGRYSKSRASWGKTANAVAFIVGDSRQATGNGFGSLVVRPNRLSGNSRSTVEDTVYLTTRYSPPPTHTRATTFTLPAGFDSRTPLPVVVFCHGSSATEEDIVPGFWGGIGAVSKALLDAGFMVVASTFGGTTNWGNPNALDTMTELYQHLRDRYPIGPIGLWGDSMGCQVALNTLARRVVPAVSFYGTRGAINLGNAHATAAYTSAIRTAFGIAGDGSDYATKTDGYDPLLREGWEFRGVPMRFVASPDDTSIPKALNTDLFVELVEPHTTEASVLTVSGDHTSNNHYNATDAVDFFKRTLRVASA